MTIVLSDAEEIVGEPADEWAGRCFEIATKIAPLIGGRALYGLYFGPIAEDSYFSARRAVGFTRHGWIEMPDGSVVDPTRWVFESTDPYIYEGPADYYDLGGSLLMQATANLKAMAGPGDPLPEPMVFATTEGHLTARALLGRDPEGWNDVWRLAHMSPYILGEHGPVVYGAIRAIGRGALIPIDFQRYYEDAGLLEEESDEWEEADE